MLFLKVDDTLYSASFFGKKNDPEWSNREVKIIKTYEMSYQDMLDTMIDGVEWSIVETRQEQELYAYDKDGNMIFKFVDDDGNPIDLYDEDGNPIEEPLVRMVEKQIEYPNYDFNISGSITDNRDGSFSIKMGKQLPLEQAYELLYGGV